MNTSQITPGTIVVGIDGSAPALQAVQWGAEQAQRQGRGLTLVHASGYEGAKPTTLRTVSDGDDIVWTDDALRASHVYLRQAQDVAEATAPEVDIHAVSIPGDTPEVLSSASESAHVMVLGSRGRGSVRSHLFGSVSAHVAKTARCPLVVVRPSEPGALKDGVVVAADATAESTPVVEFAFQQASLYGAPLTVLHCVYDVAVSVTGRAGGYVKALPDTDERSVALAESMAGLSEKYPDVHVTRLMARGLVEEVLAAHPRPWNLIVVGRHPVRGLRWLAGTTAVDVLEHAKSPVAVVPEAWPEES
jgi:nucleotide-binding universal stress UspA family protein